VPPYAPQAHFAKYHSRVVHAGDWSDVQFFAGCQLDRTHCAMCPKTAAVIAAQPRINSVIYGSHFFSRLIPGTHLSRHCGPSNFRLRCHLGLVVPPGVRIRVADEVREWKAGECLIFDDSYEHEVWHDGSEDRIVLICDLWHPEIDLERHILPMLNEKQRESMARAQAGQHICLQERTYSTGATVLRGD
jgi:aspartate beta-hydroxylase